MLSMMGRPSPDGQQIDMFLFFLAEKLGKTIAELDDMPAAELLAWRSYYTVKHSQQELATKVASRRQ